MGGMSIMELFLGLKLRPKVSSHTFSEKSKKSIVCTKLDLFAKMPGDETLQRREEDSESEEGEEDEIEQIPIVEIDPTTLTPLSPEVISKQVRAYCKHYFL